VNPKFAKGFKPHRGLDHRVYGYQRCHSLDTIQAEQGDCLLNIFDFARHAKQGGIRYFQNFSSEAWVELDDVADFGAVTLSLLTMARSRFATAGKGGNRRRAQGRAAFANNSGML
jgi:hypothetical protein